MKKPKRQRPSPAGAYDPKMLRDFMQHLEWEVRILHAECTHLQDKTNDELIDALQEFLVRRNCSGLIPVNELHAQGISEAEADALTAKFRRVNAAKYAKWLEAIETLRPLLSAAIDLCDKQSLPIQKVTPGEINTVFKQLFPNG